jgi:hypothetical protein
LPEPPSLTTANDLRERLLPTQQASYKDHVGA